MPATRTAMPLGVRRLISQARQLHPEVHWPLEVCIWFTCPTSSYFLPVLLHPPTRLEISLYSTRYFSFGNHAECKPIKVAKRLCMDAYLYGS